MSLLTFYGAAGTVTGSKYLVQTDRSQILLECGLFQGFKELRKRNWAPPLFDPKKIDSVVISHAHLDHTGYLPLLVRQHFKGKIFCSAATADLLPILLMDSANLQEEEALFANKKGYSKHKPALPLYTVADVEKTLTLIEPVPYNTPFLAAKKITALLRPAGHILGSAIVELQVQNSVTKRIVFSGDLGRWGQPILRDPASVPEADLLLLESTYGNRSHAKNPEEQLAHIIHETADKNGVLIIPSFAVGRTQEVIWIIRKLEEEKKIPILPIFLDSPMATDVTYIYCVHTEEHDTEMKKRAVHEDCPLKTKNFTFAKRPKDSKKINDLNGPMVIIASSGMMTGGRVLHHLVQRLDQSTTTILLVGYQAPGTRGYYLQNGAKEIKMLGKFIPVKAKVETIDGLSAHADKQEILRWLKGFKTAPSQTYIVHGEPNASTHLAETLRQELRWNVQVAQYCQTIEI